MENKPEFHTFSYITISGRLYVNGCLVHSINKRYLKLISDHFGVITSGKVQPYAFNVKASPLQIFSMIAEGGYHLATHSSGMNHMYKTWVYLKEGPPCNCSCHIRPDPPDERSSPPKIARIEKPQETEDVEPPIPVDNYDEIMKHFQIPTANDPLTAAELFSLLSTTGFQAPFRS